TQKTLRNFWNGSFVYVTLKFGKIKNLNLQKMMSEFRESAIAEISKADSKEQKQSFYLSIKNYFGRYAEDKSLAIRIRDEKLLFAISEGKTLTVDFEDIISAPHSLLNALLATPIQRLGMAAYKKIKVINASPEIRETIDFILDENTSSTSN
ncbi:MAG: STAS-like domain-containing protein, partial [Pyrinomonadaceae bacterium]|nr:STAS-like domain-containing protein [Pyrinomonadaceae bacterium]